MHEDFANLCREGQYWDTRGQRRAELWIHWRLLVMGTPTRGTSRSTTTYAITSCWATNNFMRNYSITSNISWGTVYYYWQCGLWTRSGLVTEISSSSSMDMAGWSRYRESKRGIFFSYLLSVMTGGTNNFELTDDLGLWLGRCLISPFRLIFPLDDPVFFFFWNTLFIFSWSSVQVKLRQANGLIAQ
jgi:hypothetical protein